MILLELMNYPLLARQISDILEIDEAEIYSKIPVLINFQCVERINQEMQEKYIVNEHVRLFSRSLLIKRSDIANSVRKKITHNFSLDKQMDYTSEEETIIGIFNNYIQDKKWMEAESFFQDQIKKKHSSKLLLFHYAIYLKEHKNDIEGALEILETIVSTGERHPNIMRLIISCYISKDIPNYDKASIYAKELEIFAHENDQIKVELASFYISWSSVIKTKGWQLDPIIELDRRGKYLELAKIGLSFLDDVDDKEKTHKICYLLAQGYFNIWKNDKALKMINNALNLVHDNPIGFNYYNKLKKKILKGISKIQRKPKAKGISY